MFYTNFVLDKKGPLAKVWLAAHWEKRLSKAHVFQTDLQSSIESIIAPKVKIALRTSGHLLLGVVRIYSRKAKYLLADCTEAMIKIKMSFRPEAVDLPIDNQNAVISTITMHNEFQEWEAMAANLGNADFTIGINNNQCRVEDITMKEDFTNSGYRNEDNFFGDTFFGETGEVIREVASVNNTIQSADLVDAEVTLKDTTLLVNHSVQDNAMPDPLYDCGFGAGEGLDFLEGFDTNNEQLPEQVVPGVEDGVTQAVLDDDTTIEAKDNIEEKMEVDKEVEVEQQTEAPTGVTGLTTAGVETTLFTRDSEALALDPIEETIVGKDKRRKRKCRLLVDDEKFISNAKMKSQLANYNDLLKKATVAPRNKKRMLMMEKSVKYLYSHPAFSEFSPALMNRFRNNLTTKVPDDLVLTGSQEEDEVVLEEVPGEILRNADTVTIPTELSNDIGASAIVDKTLAEIENDLPPVAQDFATITQGVDDEFLVEEDVTIPPPFMKEPSFENDVTLNNDVAANNGVNPDELSQWSKRVRQTMRAIESGLKKERPVNFKALTRNYNRKQAALRFYSLLMLSKEKAVSVRQDGIFQNIYVDEGEHFAQYT